MIFTGVEGKFSVFLLKLKRVTLSTDDVSVVAGL